MIYDAFQVAEFKVQTQFSFNALFAPLRLPIVQNVPGIYNKQDR